MCSWSDTGVEKCNGEWRSGSARTGSEEIGIVVWKEDTDEEHHADIEDENSPEDLTDGFGDCYAGVSCFASCDAHPNFSVLVVILGRKGGEVVHFSSCIESSSNNECFRYPIDAVCECARVVPVFEANWTRTDPSCADDNS